MNQKEMIHEPTQEYWRHHSHLAYKRGIYIVSFTNLNLPKEIAAATIPTIESSRSHRHSLRIFPSQEHGASRRIASKHPGTKAPISRPSMIVTSRTSTSWNLRILLWEIQGFSLRNGTIRWIWKKNMSKWVCNFKIENNQSLNSSCVGFWCLIDVRDTKVFINPDRRRLVRSFSARSGPHQNGGHLLVEQLKSDEPFRILKCCCVTWLVGNQQPTTRPWMQHFWLCGLQKKHGLGMFGEHFRCQWV